MIIDIKIPSPGESITEVTIVSWLKKDGSPVEIDEEILEIESEKATIRISAESAGTIKILIPEGEAVNVGTVVGTIDTTAVLTNDQTKQDNKRTETDSPPPLRSNDMKEDEHYAKGFPSPAAGKISRDEGIDLKNIQGTGKDGRIVKQDLPTQDHEGIQGNHTTNTVDQIPAAEHSQPQRNTRAQKLTPLRKKIATRLVAVKNETAMLTTFNEIDMSSVIEIRKSYKDQFKQTHGIKLGYMSFFTKAVVNSLKKYPHLNASINGDSLEFHDYIDMGIAVNAPKGLVVPIIRNAELLSLADIEKEIERLAQKAQDLSLSIHEMSGGTFTISNGGIFGSLLSTPILNPPQSGILGMHTIEDRPIAVNGSVVIHPMMYVALSYDHRVVDGKESVGFLLSVKKLLEEPVKLFLDITQ